MLTTLKVDRPCDKACVLTADEHEFIRHDSYIVYRLADTALAAHVSNMVEKRLYTPKQDVSEAVFKKIVAGLYASDNTKPRILRYAESVGLWN